MTNLRPPDPAIPPPPVLPDLLTTLEETLANLRDFTERLRAATAEPKGTPNDRP